MDLYCTSDWVRWQLTLEPCVRLGVSGRSNAAVHTKTFNCNPLPSLPPLCRAVFKLITMLVMKTPTIVKTMHFPVYDLDPTRVNVRVDGWLAVVKAPAKRVSWKAPPGAPTHAC